MFHLSKKKLLLILLSAYSLVAQSLQSVLPPMDEARNYITDIEKADNSAIYALSSDLARESIPTKILSQNSFIDQSVIGLKNIAQQELNVFHLFSHGQPGLLLLDGKWRTPTEIVQWLKTNAYLKHKIHLNIYGCNFAQGKKGRAAVEYIATALNISVAASDDITGKDGDWNLEVGATIAAIELPDYPYNLQAYIECSTLLNISKTTTSHNYQVKDGYTYMVMTTEDDLLPVINGNSHSGGANDTYLAIFDANCNQVLGTYYGGTGEELDLSLDLDANGNILLLGITESADFPTTDGTTHSGSSDLFVMKYNPTGALLFATLYGGSDLEDITHLNIDGTDIYAIGTTVSTDFGTTDGSTYGGGTNDAYVVKYDASGSLIYASLIGGSDIDTPHSTTVANGGLLVAGVTRSTDFPSTDGTTFAGGLDDAYVNYYDISGNLVFSTLLGGANNTTFFSDAPDGLAFDGTHFYVAMTIFSSDFLTTDGTVFKGSSDIGLVKYDLSGNMVFSILLAGTDHDRNATIIVQDGMIYVSGETFSDDYPVVNGVSSFGNQDKVLTKLDNNGNIIYSTHYGTPNIDSNEPILVNSAGEVYTFMNINSQFFGSVGTFNIVKFNSDGSLCFSYETPIIGRNLNESALSGDTLTIVTFANDISINGVTTDGSSPNSESPNDIGIVRFVFCPDPTPIVSDVLNPATVNVCSNGLIAQILGEELVIDGSSFPTLYVNGVPKEQADIPLAYQWQTSIASGGPWVDISGPLAQQQNYSPPPTTADTYYRRITKESDCCGGATVSTSSVTSIIVGGDTAPTVDASSTFYTCSGNAVALNATITGGTAPFTYDWNDGDFSIEDPSVSPTASTVYTLIVTDANGCKQADQATVVVYPADAGINKDVCAGVGTTIGGVPLSGIPIVASGDTPPMGIYSVEYTWSPTTDLSCSDCPNPTATPSSDAAYTLTVNLNDPNGNTCSSTDVVDIAVFSAPVNPDFAGADRVICLGDEITLGTTPANTINISSLTQTSTGPGGAATVANLTDGNFTTGGHTNNGASQAIIVDLGSLQTINQVQVAALSGRTNDDSLYIDLSTDNSTFDNIVFETSGVSATSLTTYDFDIQEVRYIRFRSGANVSDVSISEVVVDLAYEYHWSPFLYIEDFDEPSTTFDAGNLEIPVGNPITYTVTANIGTCNFYDQVTVATIEARAHGQGPEEKCGPTTIGEPDRTLNIEETYSWRIIPELTTGDSGFMGATDEREIPVSATSSGQTAYELMASYTFGGMTTSCYDTIYIVPCGCIMGYTVDPGGCPDFDLGNTTIKVSARLGDNITSEDFDFAWSPQAGLNVYNTTEVELTDNVSRTYTVTATNKLDPTVICTMDVPINSPAYTSLSFNAADTTVCKDVPVNIGDPANNSGLTYTWSNESNLDNTTISYPTATIDVTTDFMVTITDNVSGCQVLDTVRVTVETSADAGPDLNVCDNATLTIGGSPAIAGATYSWEPSGADWRNGTDEFDAMPDVFIATSQTFTLTTTSGACTTTDMMTVTVDAIPPSFTLPSLGFCPSQGTDFVLGTSDGTAGGMNEVPNGYVYAWSPAIFLDDANLQNPTISSFPTNATTFEVTLSTAGGCNQKSTQELTPAVSPALVNANRTICVGASVFIGDDANSIASITYNWTSSPDVNSELSSTTAPNPEFSPSAAGTYIFTVSKTESGCTTTTEVTVDVNEVATPTLFPQTICAGENVAIGLTDDPTLSYEWSPITDLNNAFISNPTFSGTSNANYTLTVIDGNGCTAAAGNSVTVNPAPSNVLSLRDTIICDVNTTAIALNASISPAGNYAYSWSPTTFLDNASILSPTFFIPESDTYEYVLNLSDQTTGCNTTDTITMEIAYFNPGSTVSADNTTICAGTDAILSVAATGSGLTYQWQHSTVDCATGFVDIVGATATIYTASALSQETYFRSIVYDAAGTCVDTSNCVTIFVPACDWGDLPDITSGTGMDDYQTQRDNNGPVHIIDPAITLGTTIDGESEGQASTDALGDGADEDGLTIFPSLNITPGGTLRLPLNYVNTTGMAAHIEAWIDWNANGEFDVGEMVFDESDTGDSAYDRIEISVPTDAVTGAYLGVRIRISTQDNMTPYGLINDGEVEDYLIGIDCKTQICLPIKSTILRKE